MNNPIPYFMPIPNNDLNINNEHLLNKINRLEKSIKILENRITKLEGIKENINLNIHDDPTDMYII